MASRTGDCNGSRALSRIHAPGPFGLFRVKSYMAAMTEHSASTVTPTLEDWQHWTLVMGRAQQMMMEFWADQMKDG